MNWLQLLLDRLPHDTLVIGGEPYMHRWYLAGYAPPVTCPRCAGSGGVLLTVTQSRDALIATCPQCLGAKSIPRSGWWWNWQRLGAVRLHCTVASDDSRAYHDHPWPWVSIGLKGAYIEETPAASMTHWTTRGDETFPTTARPGYGDVRRFRAPFINHKPATALHVLRLADGPVWTLFFSGPKVRTWGFSGPFGWIRWRDFETNPTGAS